ncbi:MAG: hypothetical protein KA080_02345 [Leptotrichiaceae bacterium]|nr:hypothetical protein [Leptotrichiaceae bacterium]MBP9629711.1 hypothetical protein [Leptotrichiaceae bacterium]
MNKIYKTALFSILIFQCSTVNNVGNVKLKEENYVCAYDTNLKVVYYDKWIKIYDNSDKEYKLKLSKTYEDTNNKKEIYFNSSKISFVSEEKYIKGVNKKAVFSPNRKPIKCELYINLNSEGKEEYQIEN